MVSQGTFQWAKNDVEEFWGIEKIAGAIQEEY